MIYKKCDASDIRINTQAFSDLFISVYNMNFPDRRFDCAFGHERVKDIIGYVNDNTATIYGAFDGDKLAGFIWGYKRQINDELRIHVPVLVVSEQYQRKGIARQLMELMKSYASDCGINIIEVMVTSSNEDAIKYYGNVGFKEARKLLELRIQYYDVTTPYGYGGPVVVEGVATPESVKSYYDAWAEYCRAEKIVAEFIRYHLFDNAELRDAFPGEVLHVTEDVVRLLDDSMDDMWMKFEHKVRKNVKKAQNNGLTVTTDGTGEQLEAFLDIYYKTMERNEAKSFYYFDRAYFQAIIDTLPERFMFFHVWKDDVVVSTELVLCSEKYVYSFLGGTLDEYYPMRPNDLLKYEIIKWAKETSHQAFILGGGYGTNDGIYKYKKAFAPGDDVPFFVGRKVWDEDAYQRLVEQRQENESSSINESYFPLYRG